MIIFTSFIAIHLNILQNIADTYSDSTSILVAKTNSKYCNLFCRQTIHIKLISNILFYLVDKLGVVEIKIS